MSLLSLHCCLHPAASCINSYCMNSQQYGLAVPRAGDRSYVTGSIRGWSRSQLTYLMGGCSLKERKLTSQSPSITVEFSVQYNLKITSVIHIFINIYCQQYDLAVSHAGSDSLRRVRFTAGVYCI